MRFLDCFAGIGGFRMGLELAGHKCVGHIETGKKVEIKRITQFINREEMNFLEKISQKLTQENYLNSTSCVADSLAKLFQLLEKGKVLKIQEELSYLNCLGLLKKKDHRIYSLRMSEDSSATTKGEHSEQSSWHWMKSGMMCNGKCLTLNISECHRTEKECTLSDILEEEVDDQYYLSDKMTDYLLKQMNQTAHNHKPHIVQR